MQVLGVLTEGSTNSQLRFRWHRFARVDPKWIRRRPVSVAHGQLVHRLNTWEIFLADKFSFYASLQARQSSLQQYHPCTHRARTFGSPLIAA
jgi:hypothetical protein